MNSDGLCDDMELYFRVSPELLPVTPLHEKFLEVLTASANYARDIDDLESIRFLEEVSKDLYNLADSLDLQTKLAEMQKSGLNLNFAGNAYHKLSQHKYTKFSPSPFLYYVIQNKVDIVRALLAFGVKYDTGEQNDRYFHDCLCSPYYYAVSSDMGKVLIENGYPIPNDIVPFVVSESSRDQIYFNDKYRIFREHSYNRKTVDVSQMLEFFISQNAGVNEKMYTNMMKSAFTFALFTVKNVSIAKYLVSCGANPNLYDSNSKNVFHAIAGTKHMGEKDKCELIRYFLEIVGDAAGMINKKDKYGKTPKCYATSESVRALF